MAFVLLPAIDVAGGRVARLVDGVDAAACDPRDVALAWQADGAEWIHLVDLDAAFGRGSNADALAALIAELDVDVELSGGIGDDESLRRALSTSCACVVVATAALADHAWCARAIARHGERIAIGLDVRIAADRRGGVRHRLAGRGANHDQGELWETVGWLDRAGCARYVVTDVTADGALCGPNIELYRAMATATPAAVIASGGVAAISDLVALAQLVTEGSNLEGSILGTALHAGRFTLPAALAAVRRADLEHGHRRTVVPESPP